MYQDLHVYTGYFTTILYGEFFFYVNPVVVMIAKERLYTDVFHTARLGFNLNTIYFLSVCYMYGTFPT